MTRGIMDLAIELVRREGIERIPEHAERAAEAGVKAAQKWLDSPGAAKVAPPAWRELAAQGLDGLRPAVPHLAALARDEAAAAFNALADDDWGTARELLLEAQLMTPEQRIEAQVRGDLEALQAEFRREAAWDAFVAVAKDVATDALKAAIPLILAALA